MMKIIYALLFMIYQTAAQQFTLKGTVSDKATNQSLSYANIRIASTSTGTSATIDGRYELKLRPGNYQLVVSSIGYITETANVELKTNTTLNILLTPSPVNLPEVTVLPGENPALEIIRKIIQAKHSRDEKLNTYIFHAFTKGLIRTTGDFNSSGSSVSIGIGKKQDDSTLMKITGIIENESMGYFKKPNKYKDEIIARKQSANTPAAVNIFTGGRLLQNFYSDDVRFFNRKLPSPIADDAIGFYDYFIEDTLTMDTNSIFKIKFEPLNRIDPGFVGHLYIADKSYHLVKIETSLNAPANPGRLLDKIDILQQFATYDNDIAMPIDYRITAEANLMGLLKIGFELSSIFYDYKINSNIDDDFFDMTIVKVFTDADKKDSLYWKNTQTLPNSDEELNAYKHIDSVEAQTKGFWDNFSFIAPTININKNWSIDGPLNTYSFNRVEGHTVNFGTSVFDLFDKRFNSSFDISYGFGDQKLKAFLSARFLLGEYRTTNISFNAFSNLVDLFSESIRYSKLTSTYTNLFGKYDFRDYYYTKGFSFNIYGQVFPILNLGIGLYNRTDNSGAVNTDFSFFNKSKVYNENKSIFETKVNALTTFFQLDFRRWVEDGYFRRRINEGGGYAMLTGNFSFGNSDILKSNLDFEVYRLTLYGAVPTYGSASLNFSLLGIYSSGTIPFQMLYSLPGNIESISQTYTMRTLRTGEVFGDRVYTLSLEHNFSDELFRLLGLNFLVDWQMNLSVHFNAASSIVTGKSRLILPLHASSPIEFTKPFYELGFGIGQALSPFRLEFTWKLNYFGNNNFVIGLNAPIL